MSTNEANEPGETPTDISIGPPDSSEEPSLPYRRSRQIWAGVGCLALVVGIIGVSGLTYYWHDLVAGCTTVTLTNNAPQPISAGQKFALEATSWCGSALQFQLTISNPDGSTQVTNNWEWNRARSWIVKAGPGPGIYSYQARVRVGVHGRIFQSTRSLWLVADTPVDIHITQNDTALASQMNAACNTDTLNCQNVALAAISAARALEHLQALTIPSDFWSLSAGEQTLILVDEERTSRGLAPFTGTTTQLDIDAIGGAKAKTDPTYPNSQYNWASNWAEGVNSAVDDFNYMYDDGWAGSAASSDNLDCKTAHASGCWGHRNNILSSWSRDVGRALQLGVACVPLDQAGYYPSSSCGVLFVDASNPQPYIYTWAQAEAGGA